MFFVTFSAYRKSFTLSDVMTAVGKGHYHRLEFMDSVCCWYRDAIEMYLARGYLKATSHPFIPQPTIVYIWNKERTPIIKALLIQWLFQYASLGPNEVQLIRDWTSYYRRLLDKLADPVLPLGSVLISYDPRTCPAIEAEVLDATYCPHCNRDRLFDCTCLPMPSPELERAISEATSRGENEHRMSYLEQAVKRDLDDGTQPALTPPSLPPSQNGY